MKFDHHGRAPGPAEILRPPIELFEIVAYGLKLDSEQKRLLDEASVKVQALERLSATNSAAETLVAELEVIFDRVGQIKTKRREYVDLLNIN